MFRDFFFVLFWFGFFGKVKVKRKMVANADFFLLFWVRIPYAVFEVVMLHCGSVCSLS